MEVLTPAAVKMQQHEGADVTQSQEQLGEREQVLKGAEPTGDPFQLSDMGVQHQGVTESDGLEYSELLEANMPFPAHHINSEGVDGFDPMISFLRPREDGEILYHTHGDDHTGQMTFGIEGRGVDKGYQAESNKDRSLLQPYKPDWVRDQILHPVLGLNDPMGSSGGVDINKRRSSPRSSRSSSGTFDQLSPCHGNPRSPRARTSMLPCSPSDSPLTESRQAVTYHSVNYGSDHTGSRPNLPPHDDSNICETPAKRRRQESSPCFNLKTEHTEHSGAEQRGCGSVKLDTDQWRCVSEEPTVSPQSHRLDHSHSQPMKSEKSADISRKDVAEINTTNGIVTSSSHRNDDHHNVVQPRESQCGGVETSKGVGGNVSNGMNGLDGGPFAQYHEQMVAQALRQHELDFEDQLHLQLPHAASHSRLQLHEEGDPDQREDGGYHDDHSQLPGDFKDDSFHRGQPQFLVHRGGNQDSLSSPSTQASLRRQSEDPQVFEDALGDRSRQMGMFGGDQGSLHKFQSWSVVPGSEVGFAPLEHQFHQSMGHRHHQLQRLTEGGRASGGEPHSPLHSAAGVHGGAQLTQGEHGQRHTQHPHTGQQVIQQRQAQHPHQGQHSMHPSGAFSPTASLNVDAVLNDQGGQGHLTPGGHRHGLMQGAGGQLDHQFLSQMEGALDGRGGTSFCRPGTHMGEVPMGDDDFDADGFQGEDGHWVRRPIVEESTLNELCEITVLNNNERFASLIVDYQDGISFPLGEGGRELLRACLNAKGCKGRQLQGASVPQLLSLARDWGMWNIALRIKVERATGELCSKHEAFVNFKAMQSQLRKYMKREQMSIERDETGQIRTIHYEEQKYLTLGKEGREKLRAQLRRMHDKDSQKMDDLLDANQFKYSELRNATVPQLLKMAHICCMWEEVIQAVRDQEQKRDNRHSIKHHKGEFSLSLSPPIGAGSKQQPMMSPHPHHLHPHHQPYLSHNDLSAGLHLGGSVGHRSPSTIQEGDLGISPSTAASLIYGSRFSYSV
eukprot:GHVN01060080.1.p1 GENE.GHVN01060080.1~~GHVN01060080.1.p1  ORF type:complete len:1011 (-),score=172.05 GHVN01060080.1:2056-5088(-)